MSNNHIIKWSENLAKKIMIEIMKDYVLIPKAKLIKMNEEMRTEINKHKEFIKKQEEFHERIKRNS